MKKPATVDEYLEGIAEPARTTLGAMRRTMRDLLPEAAEVLSYGMPAYKLDGITVGGFAAFKAHCGYFPFSGKTLESFTEELARYGRCKSGIRFSLDKPLPKTLVRKLVRARIAEGAARSKHRLRNGR